MCTQVQLSQLRTLWSLGREPECWLRLGHLPSHDALWQLLALAANCWGTFWPLVGSRAATRNVSTSTTGWCGSAHRSMRVPPQITLRIWYLANQDGVARTSFTVSPALETEPTLSSSCKHAFVPSPTGTCFPAWFERVLFIFTFSPTPRHGGLLANSLLANSYTSVDLPAYFHDCDHLLAVRKRLRPPSSS